MSSDVEIIDVKFNLHYELSVREDEEKNNKVISTMEEQCEKEDSRSSLIIFGPFVGLNTLYKIAVCLACQKGFPSERSIIDHLRLKHGTKLSAIEIVKLREAQICPCVPPQCNQNIFPCIEGIEVPFGFVCETCYASFAKFHQKAY